MNIIVSHTSSARLKLWAIFVLYLIVAGYAMAHHELWGDEIHSWNIVKASGSFSDLISNTRYEGHPPVWYSILWSISKFTHNLAYVQAAQFLIAGSVVFVLLFYSPFPFVVKALIPFGYYFLFEYGILSRNYAIGILPAFCICYILRKDFRYKLLLYYALLFFLSNTHLVGLLLAVSLHFYFLLLSQEQKKDAKKLFRHLLLGVLVFLPALYFIFPPSDSGLSIDFWIAKLDSQQVRIISKTPLRVFVPVPAWWEYNFWNTQFLLTLQEKDVLLRLVTLLLSIGLLAVAVFILRRNKKSLSLFAANLILTFIIGFIFPLTTQRYIGFIYVGFIAALWLYCYELKISKRNIRLINILLVIQIIAGAFTVFKDIKLPFSNSDKINELIEKVPATEKIITDYWCVNTVSAFTDKTFYCIGLDREVGFLLWKKEFDTRLPGVFLNSLGKLFDKEKLEQVYLISTYSPQLIFQLDNQVGKYFKFDVIDKREGAIEKWSNLYLYQVSRL